MNIEDFVVKAKIGGHFAIIHCAGDPLTIKAGNEAFQFEWHHYHGPILLDGHGNPSEKILPENSPFWDAIHWWRKQGSRVTKRGVCKFKWEMGLVCITKQIGKRSRLILHPKVTNPYSGIPESRRRD